MSSIQCSLQDCTRFRDEMALKQHSGNRGILKLLTVTWLIKAFSFSCCWTQVDPPIQWQRNSGTVLYSPGYEVNLKSLVTLFLSVSYICQFHDLSLFDPWPLWPLLCRTGRHTAGGDPVTAEMQTRIRSVVPAVTTGPAASVWTRADAHSTAVAHPGCTDASSVAAWSVHRNTDTHSHRSYMKADLYSKSLSVVRLVC